MGNGKVVAGAIAGFLLVAVAGVLLRPALPVDETRYLSVAWEMWLAGDYLVPTKNFALYTDKPPLLFWLINLVWLFTGVSEIAARLVGPAAAATAIALVARLAARLWPDDPDIGGRAALALAGLLVFALSGGLTMFDAMLAVATLAGMLALVRAVETGLRRWWVALGLAIALGVITKGPVILFHLGPAALLAPVWGKALREMPLREGLTGVGIALLSALAAVSLWVGPAALLGGEDYRRAILWTQSAGRMSQSFAHARPWWFYLAVFPALAFPWVFAPALLRGLARAAWSEAGLRLAAVWVLGAMLLFSAISGKQIHYMVPELAAIALIVARVSRDVPRFTLFWAGIPLLVLAGLAIAVAAGLLPSEDVLQLFDPPSRLLAWGLVMIAIVWLGVRTGGLRGGAVLTLGLVLSLNLLTGLSAAATLYETGRVARMIAPHEGAGIALYGQTYHAEFNFTGRLTRPVATPDDEAELQAWAQAHPQGVIIARPDRRAPGWSPRETLLFRNSSYGIWNVADAPSQEVEP
ncbi:ArnT family glycosyltransferase [Palleronia sp. KMU-117]|uniref:ArnT family glycosyltransferase n=1 Tax=Palleronia sp. KMU-117 TaxID=3434108 RepID=UPI003D74BF8E